MTGTGTDALLQAEADLQRAIEVGALAEALSFARQAVDLSEAVHGRNELAYLRDNREVRPSIFQSALVRAGKTDEAEQYFLSRLEDPVLRADALLSAQNYIRPDSVSAATEDSDWEKFISRPVIQRGIAQVGRIETYTLPARISR